MTKQTFPDFTQLQTRASAQLYAQTLTKALSKMGSEIPYEAVQTCRAALETNGVPACKITRSLDKLARKVYGESCTL